MTDFTAIPLERLPAPQVLRPLDFEGELAAAKAEVLVRTPEGAERDALAAKLELLSEPIVKLLEAFAWRLTVKTAEWNDQARGTMLAHAWGATLDNLAALYGIERLVIDEGDPDARPPVPPVLEDDAALRRRVQLAPEGFTGAGTPGQFLANTLAVAGVRDAAFVSPEPVEVDIYVLGFEGDGAPSAELIADVDAVHAKWRGLGIEVRVHPPAITSYDIEAELTLLPGPAAAPVLEAAHAGAQAYAEAQHALSHDIVHSALAASMYVPGVQRVRLVSPPADLVLGPAEAAHCASISVTEVGRDV